MGYMRSKSVIGTIFGILFVILILLALNIKSAYKAVPMKVSDEMKVPAFAEWREFTAQTGKFEVLLPAAPQYAKEAVPIPNMEDKKRRYEMYVSEKMNSTIFMVSLITYPSDFDMSNIDEMLHSAVDEMMQTNPKNRLTKNEDSQFNGNQALDFEIDNMEYHIAGKVFLVGKTVYLLTYIAKDDNFNLKEYEHFIDSFKLLNGKEEAQSASQKNNSELPID